MTPTVTLSPDGSTATFARQHWSATFPAASLPAWRAFYARLAKIGPAQQAAHGPWLAAIDGVGK